MGPVLAFTVSGKAVPQGSKIGGRTKSGAHFVRESNAHALDAWRVSVAKAALAEVEACVGRVVRGEMVAQLPLVAEGPVAVHVVFTFPRPKAHYGTGRNARTLKPKAPWYVPTKPDVDKLARAVFDALSGIAYRDDAQVASARVSKVYGPRPSAWVEVSGLPHAGGVPLGGAQA